MRSDTQSFERFELKYWAPSARVSKLVELAREFLREDERAGPAQVNTSLYFADRITELVEALPKPCLATLGNHDHWTDPERVTRALANGGARVLRNESTVVEGRGWSLPVVGVDDGRSGNADVARSFSNVDTNAVHRALVLSHFPTTVQSIAETGAPLVLSGHTHGGQIDAKGVTKWVAKLAGNPFLHGFYRIAQTDLYVSAGIGHSLAGLRDARTSPEIAVFELCPETRERRSCTLRTAW